MNDPGNCAALPLTASRPAGWFPRLARRLIIDRLKDVRAGGLTLIDAGGRHRLGRHHDELQAGVTVHDPAFYSRLLREGSLGAAESYLRGEWSTGDLTALFRLFLRNPQLGSGVDAGLLSRLAKLAARGVHRLRPNTLGGSRKNIHAHYDLGNDFFALFLDETLTYSCGIFERPESTLAEASRAKLDRLCRKLALSPADHLLEIGTGWGSLALHAASRYGCRVTTATISQAQFQHARWRVAEAGLADRVTVLLADYRELRGRFSKLVSVEMIEAVGHDFLAEYFSHCSHLLTADGLMALQAITMPDHRYPQYLRSADFIQTYIFPGGCCPSLGAMTAAIGRASDLKVTHLEDIGPHYATTLRHWRERFTARLDRVRELGYSARFIRMWEYYLAYCEAGFAERYLGTLQLVLAKPGNQRPPILPPRSSL